MSAQKLQVTLISVFLLVACQTMETRWHKDGASKQDLAKDKYPCLQEAQQQVSETYVPSKANKYSAAESSSGSVTNWLLFDACMEARGWSKEEYQEN